MALGDAESALALETSGVVLPLEALGQALVPGRALLLDRALVLDSLGVLPLAALVAWEDAVGPSEGVAGETVEEGGVVAAHVAHASGD